MSTKARQIIVAVLASAVVLGVSGYLLVWGDWQTLRSAQSQLEQIRTPAPQPEPGSAGQRTAIPDRLADQTATSAIRAAAAGMNVVSVKALPPARQLGERGPLSHPFRVVLEGDLEQLAAVTRRLQEPVTLSDGRLVGRSGALLLRVRELASTPGTGAAPDRVSLVVDAFSRR